MTTLLKVRNPDLGFWVLSLMVLGQYAAKRVKGFPHSVAKFKEDENYVIASEFLSSMIPTKRTVMPPVPWELSPRTPSGVNPLITIKQVHTGRELAFTRTFVKSLQQTLYKVRIVCNHRHFFLGREAFEGFYLKFFEEFDNGWWGVGKVSEVNTTKWTSSGSWGIKQGMEEAITVWLER